MIDLTPGLAGSFVVSMEHKVIGAYMKDIDGFYLFIPAFVSMDVPMLGEVMEKLIEINANPTSTKH